MTRDDIKSGSSKGWTQYISIEDKEYHFHRPVLYVRDNEFQTFLNVTDFNKNCRKKLHILTLYIT